ncbi:malate dehydrogenase [Pyrus ussuriensis x Pyrus communis]|uniref:malate dehydrogenase n=1 Tax=Pyrus ussuriensis x Pyrus communis TaxID=2448454 RepID=A0A5N5HMH3_9ROSA|nr:malate dehydrogenase [Pyrus ussuriensis x Pyrus communis]
MAAKMMSAVGFEGIHSGIGHNGRVALPKQVNVPMKVTMQQSLRSQLVVKKHNLEVKATNNIGTQTNEENPDVTITYKVAVLGDLSRVVGGALIGSVSIAGADISIYKDDFKEAELGGNVEELKRCLQGAKMVIVAAGISRNAMKFTYDQMLAFNSPIIDRTINAIALHCADAFICFLTQPIEHAMRSTAKALKSNIGFDPLKLHGFCVTDLSQFSFKIEEYYYKSKTNIQVPVGMEGYALECIEQCEISKFGRGTGTLWLEISVAKYITDCIRKLMLDNKP